MCALLALTLYCKLIKFLYLLNKTYTIKVYGPQKLMKEFPKKGAKSSD